MSINDNASRDSLDLMLRYVGSDCTEAECEELARHLAGSEQAREAMCDLALEAIAVSEQRGDASFNGEPQATVIRQKHTDAFGLPLNEARIHRWVWQVALAAAVAVAVGLGCLYSTVTASTEIVRIAELSGSVRWIGDGGEVLDDLRAGMSLSGGVAELLSDDALLTLAFRDGSAVSLAGESRATSSEIEGQKKVHLGAGRLSANVQRQPAGKPFLIETPTALLEVVGTQFDVESVATATLLSVNEGSVRVTRRVDGSVVEVPADHQTVASLRPEEDLQPKPRKAFSHSWASSLDAMPMGAEGQWLPASAGSAARLRAVPSVSMRNGQPRTVQRVKLRINGNAPQPLQLQANTTVRVRGRLARPARVVCLLGTGGPQGGFAGNYFHSEKPANHESWAIEFTLSDLEPQRAGHVASSPDGLVLNCIILYTRGEQDLGLEIEGVEVIGSDDSQATSFNGEPKATVARISESNGSSLDSESQAAADQSE